MPPRIPDCPLARTVEQIGPWWTLEILHETYDGFTRFEEIRQSLRTPADVLADRLSALVASGLLTAVTADEKDGGRDDGKDGARDDGARVVGDAGRTAYHPTELGRSLRPLILLMAAWGNHRLPAEQRGLILVDVRTGAEADPVVVDRHTGRPLDTADFTFATGPAAGPELRARYPRRPAPPTPA